LSSCTGQNISDKNKDKTLPTSGTIGVNNIGFQTSTPAKPNAVEDNNTNLQENTPTPSETATTNIDDSIDNTKYNKYLDFLNVDGEVLDCITDDITVKS